MRDDGVAPLERTRGGLAFSPARHREGERGGGMGRKTVEASEVETRDGLLGVSTPARTTEVRPVLYSLTGTVHVDFDVSVTEDGGPTRHTLVRVEFPDEVRSMLEQSSWRRGITIQEALGRLGAAFLERTGVGCVVGTLADGAALMRPTTLHLPLSYVRATLAAVCAAIT